MKKNNNLIPLLIIVLTGAFIVKAMQKKVGVTTGVTPEQKLANLTSQLATAYEGGDNDKIVSLQRQIEIAELEAGL